MGDSLGDSLGLALGESLDVSGVGEEGTAPGVGAVIVGETKVGVTLVGGASVAPSVGEEATGAEVGVGADGTAPGVGGATVTAGVGCDPGGEEQKEMDETAPDRFKVKRSCTTFLAFKITVCRELLPRKGTESGGISSIFPASFDDHQCNDHRVVDIKQLNVVHFFCHW